MGDDQEGEIEIEIIPQCFAAGTQINTECGSLPIEEVRVGDRVWAWDETRDSIQLRQVRNLFRHNRNALLEIQVGADRLRVTPEHPFYTSHETWTQAKDLEIGDGLMAWDGTPLSVNRIARQEGQFTVFNFEVETDHNYFVGEQGILTHNANKLRTNMGLKHPLLAAHHIVAIRAAGAKAARKLLLAAGTGITDLNSALNGVALPKNLQVKAPRGYKKAVVHSLVHTEKYYLELTARLSAVAPGRRISVLRTMAGDLKAGRFKP